jgi:hypothetical protein
MSKVKRIVIFAFLLGAVLFLVTPKLVGDEYGVAVKKEAENDQANIKDFGAVDSLSIVKMISASDAQGAYRDYRLSIRGSLKSAVATYRCRKLESAEIVCKRIAVSD